MVSETDILHIAQLADIGISKDEVAEFTTQVNAVLGYFDLLDAVEGDSALIADLSNVFREDEVAASLSQDEALANAGSTEDGFIKAPRVM
jgi:aspartyl-tRNA(Asn)/glutamyl-tRNA(Gln) amidotransferase subunit C